MQISNKIRKAINEGLNNALLTFDDDDFADMQKTSKKPHKNTNTLLANDLVDKTLKTKECSESDWQYIQKYAYYPADIEQLRQIVIIFCNLFGWEIDLNWIDTSQVVDMTMLFEEF